MALVGQMLIQGYGCGRDLEAGRGWVAKALVTAEVGGRSSEALTVGVHVGAQSCANRTSTGAIWRIFVRVIRWG